VIRNYAKPTPQPKPITAQAVGSSFYTTAGARRRERDIITGKVVNVSYATTERAEGCYRRLPTCHDEH